MLLYTRMVWMIYLLLGLALLISHLLLILKSAAGTYLVITRETNTNEDLLLKVKLIWGYIPLICRFTDPWLNNSSISQLC